MKVDDAGEKLAQLAENMYENKDKKFSWSAFKDKALRFVGSLVMEKDADGMWAMSTGKVSWWISFLPAIYMWMLTDVEIKDNHLTVILTLAGYNMGKKLVSSASGLLASRRHSGGNSESNLGPG